MELSGAEVLCGDCRDVLPTLPEKHFHTCVTSPPYWGQRDYGTAQWEGGDPECDHLDSVENDARKRNRRGLATSAGGGRSTEEQSGISRTFQFKSVCGKCGARRIDNQIGLEKNFRDYVSEMVEVGRAIRRVLRDDGTFWLNLGDKYSTGSGGSGTESKKQRSNHAPMIAPRGPVDGMKPKNLLGIPWRVALALQDDGWILRQEIIWHKPNAMPESCDDRPSRNHEQIFLFSKRPDYFYDAFAIRERASDPNRPVQQGYARALPGNPYAGQNDGDWGEQGFKNKRSVWTVTVAGEKESHFAVFPPKLILPCILAGTSEKGCCSKCGAPWRRLLEKTRRPTRPGNLTKVRLTEKDASRLAGGIPTKGGGTRQAQSDKTTLHCSITGNRDPERHCTESWTVGWEPSCKCGSKRIVPCRVLDPFAGSGTTLSVAIKKGRHATGVELNPEYVEIIKRKLRKAELRKGFCL